MISHESALSVYDLSDVLPHEIHVVVPRTASRRRKGIRQHTNQLEVKDITTRDGLPITTVARTLESVWDNNSDQVRAGAGKTGIFIYPGYSFKVIDVLLTNFHLPQSTLLMLVAAFAGHDLIFEAYKQAIAERYRFYSYGDCMLIQ